MKASLTFSGLLLLIGFTSGHSTSLRLKDDETHAHVDLESWSVLQERQRSLRPKAVKSKGSKRNNDVGVTASSITTGKKSSKKGGNNDIIINPPSNNEQGTNAPGVTPADEPSVTVRNRTFVPASNRTLVPASNKTSVPTSNKTLVPATNNPTVPTNGKKDSLQPCNDDNECLSNACGLENLQSIVLGEKVCCVSGNSYSFTFPVGASLNAFCTQPLGAACLVDDGLCISGICAGAVCVDGLQPDGGSCDKSGECTSGQCARERVEVTSPMVCCPQGVGTSLVFVLDIEFENMACSNQPIGARCSTPSGADNNEVCASKTCVNNKCA